MVMMVAMHLDTSGGGGGAGGAGQRFRIGNIESRRNSYPWHGG